MFFFYSAQVDSHLKMVRKEKENTGSVTRMTALHALKSTDVCERDTRNKKCVGV